jgi:predicted ATPase
MTSLLDWSYDLLDQPERTVFERLAVFAGTFGLDAASAIAGPGIDLHRRAGGERDAIPDARDRACLRVGSMDRVG